jgi:hypothetical protein
MAPLLGSPLEPVPPLAPLAMILISEKYNSEVKYERDTNGS